MQVNLQQICVITRRRNPGVMAVFPKAKRENPAASQSSHALRTLFDWLLSAMGDQARRACLKHISSKKPGPVLFKTPTSSDDTTQPHSVLGFPISTQVPSSHSRTSFVTNLPPKEYVFCPPLAMPLHHHGLLVYGCGRIYWYILD